MNKQKNIARFISNVANNNFKKANEALAAVVNEKIQQRVRTADQKLSTSKR